MIVEVQGCNVAARQIGSHVDSLAARCTAGIQNLLLPFYGQSRSHKLTRLILNRNRSTFKELMPSKMPLFLNQG